MCRWVVTTVDSPAVADEVEQPVGLVGGVDEHLLAGRLARSRYALLSIGRTEILVIVRS